MANDLDNAAIAQQLEAFAGLLDLSGSGYYTSRAYRRAAETFRHQGVWAWLVQRAMKEDVSWSRSAVEYVQLYLAAIAAHREKHGVAAVSVDGGTAAKVTPAPVGE